MSQRVMVHLMRTAAKMGVSWLETNDRSRMLVSQSSNLMRRITWKNEERRRRTAYLLAKQYQLIWKMRRRRSAAKHLHISGLLGGSNMAARDRGRSFDEDVAVIAGCMVAWISRSSVQNSVVYSAQNRSL